MEKFDFSGWATKANLRCSDGRTIMSNAFKDDDGCVRPLVWNHQHNDPKNFLGQALLEHRDEGMYAYCTFNDTESGKTAKQLVEHGDVTALSIFANRLQQDGGNVMHGEIKEVSLVLAGANPGAYIDSVMMHGEGDNETIEEAIIYTGESISLYHADSEKKEDKKDDKKEEKKEESSKDDSEEKKEEPKDKTVKEVLDTLNEDQKTVVYGLMGKILTDGNEDESDEEDKKETKGGKESMKHNVFDKEKKDEVLCHADQENILAMAKTTSVGSLQDAISIFAEESESLKHGIDDIEQLFPEYKDVRPGAPDLVERDQSWVSVVMNKVQKSPISRIRTRQADVRGNDVRAHGYQTKGDQKTLSGNIKLLNRTTDPQTVYRKDELHRDDIVDITEFDVVNWLYGIMRRNLEEDIALSILVGDGREDGDADKIHEDHIRSIWHDADLYTIHKDVDIASTKASLQGTNTSANFGDNYIYAEAIIAASLYAREDYKGSGTPDLYCTPRLLNVMLLARDLNGRRIYDSKADLAAALNVGAIYTVEQFEGRTRTVGGKTKNLLGIFVNLADYQIGSTKGGEITRFNQFDIDFNKEKYLIETRLSGALTRVYSAVALEEVVNG